MRFVHISDLHLGKTFPVARYGQLAARRRQELLDTFSRLIDYVNENQVDFILCSGDFLNSEELRVEELRNINAIIDRLQLRRPIYRATAAYGHFGRTDVDLPWERLDYVDALKRELSC